MLQRPKNYQQTGNRNRTKNSNFWFGFAFGFVFNCMRQQAFEMYGPKRFGRTKIHSLAGILYFCATCKMNPHIENLPAIRVSTNLCFFFIHPKPFISCVSHIFVSVFSMFILPTQIHKFPLKKSHCSNKMLQKKIHICIFLLLYKI